MMAHPSTADGAGGGRSDDSRPQKRAKLDVNNPGAVIDPVREALANAARADAAAMVVRRTLEKEEYCNYFERKLKRN